MPGTSKDSVESLRGADRRPLGTRSAPTGLQSPAAQTQNPTAEWEGAVK